jgi:hypothetical protein
MITVNFATLAEFISELECGPKDVADSLVRWTVNRTPEQKEAISFQVDVWATAVIVRSDADYLIEFGSTVGRNTQHNEAAGDREADKLKQRLIDACQQLHLHLRPGKIEVY